MARERCRHAEDPPGARQTNVSGANGEIDLRLEAVQRVLFEIWDPIDINPIAPKDEYHSFAPAVLDYLWSGGSREGLILMLDGFIRNEIEIKPIPGRSAAAADALFKLRDEI
jgi:hypothetical protein